MKVTLVDGIKVVYDTSVFNMPRHSFGVDSEGMVYYRSYTGLHKLGAFPGSWEMRIQPDELPQIKVRLLQPGEKILIEIT